MAGTDIYQQLHSVPFPTIDNKPILQLDYIQFFKHLSDKEINDYDYLHILL